MEARYERTPIARLRSHRICTRVLGVADAQTLTTVDRLLHHAHPVKPLGRRAHAPEPSTAPALPTNRTRFMTQTVQKPCL